MVYLECPYCEENTEHYITHLSRSDLQVRCTECLRYRDGYVMWDVKTHKEAVKEKEEP